MTIKDHIPADEPYWNKVLELLRHKKIKTILFDSEVRKRSNTIIQENASYQALLKKHTHLVQQVAISDFRDLDSLPYGNRFLVYSMFPEAVVSVKIGFENPRKETVVVKVGHSILNKNCRVNVGQMLSYFQGGGHKGAGACSFPVGKADEYLPKIIDILRENEPEGSIVVKINVGPRIAGAAMIAEKHLRLNPSPRRYRKEEKVNEGTKRNSAKTGRKQTPGRASR